MVKKLWLCIPPEGLFKHSTICNAEVNKDQPNEKIKGYLLRTCDSKGVGHVTCILAETQRQAEEWKSFIVEKREGFGCI